MKALLLFNVLAAHAEVQLWPSSEYNYRQLSFGALSEDMIMQVMAGDTSDSKESWRLPRTADGQLLVSPIHYDVEISMSGLYEDDMEQQGVQKFFTFNATSEVQVQCNAETNTIVMHAGDTYNFLVKSVSVDGIDTDRFEHYKDKEYLIITLDSPCKQNDKRTLRILSSSNLRKDMKGLYETSYDDPDGKTHYMATTQFESVGARKTFVCFDEPEYKATFNMTITTKYEEYIARWNMPTLEREDLGNDYYRWTFDRSMTMSTYLLAIVISDYDFSETGVSPGTGTSVTVAGPKHRIDQGLGEYGKNISMAIIDGYSEYYGYDYADSFTGSGGAKSDQFGISDFAAGAMENWGLVTYKMGLAYNNPLEFPEGLNVQVATVYCHELSHQWTGNLITTTWWDEIWIHESFADIGGFLGLRWAEPTWNWNNEFFNSQVMNGLRVDARPTTRPLINKQNNDGFKVETPRQIMIQFDQIAYAKGGSILRMMQHVITEETWIDGMRPYLNQNKFTNVDGEVYFSYMQDAIDRADTNSQWSLPYGRSFNETFDCWVRQSGHPIVYLESAIDANNIDYVKVSQERFMHFGTDLDKPESSFGYKWNIPLSYINVNNDYKLAWFMADLPSVSFNGKLGRDIWFDPEAYTFVRFHYTNIANLREAITEMCARDISSFPSNVHLSAAKLISDQFEMATAQYDYGITYLEVMESTRLLACPALSHQPSSWPVWFQASWAFRQSAFADVDPAVKNPYESTHELMLFSANAATYRTYMKSLGGANGLDAVYGQGIENLTHEQKRMAPYMVEWLCLMGDEKCLTINKDYFDRVRRGELSWRQINVNIRDFAINYGVRASQDRDDLEWLVEQREQLGDRKFFEALSFTTDVEFVVTYLDNLVDKDNDAFVAAIRQMGKSHYLRDPVFEYLIERQVDLSVNDWNNILVTLCHYIQTLEDLVRVEELGDRQDISTSSCKSSYESNVAWQEKYGNQIVTWLRTRPQNYIFQYSEAH